MKTLWLTMGLVLALAGPAAAQAPRLEIADGKYPLWEIRPLDRRVYVVSLDGTWKKPPSPGSSYSMAVKFPDGTIYAHRPINDELFYKGEMRFMLPDYLLARTGAARGGRVTLYVVERPAAGSPTEIVSNTVEIDWPLRRAIARRPPPTKFTPKRPIDAMPLPDEGK
jgi:hypothetical protein